jgi:hypothetical protein
MVMIVKVKQLLQKPVTDISIWFRENVRIIGDARN